MHAPHARRTSVAALGICLAVAVGVPTGWALAQPEDAVGVSPLPVPTAQDLRALELGRGTPGAPAVQRPAPTRIEVPRLGIDATITSVGVREDGQMEVPAELAVAGWYRFGPNPLDPAGSAVVAAHVDTPQGDGAFSSLRDAQPGDLVRTTLADGSVAEFTVTGRSQWEKEELPVAAVFDPVGPPRLTLITCGGRFDRDTGRYTDNVVVTAERAVSP